MKDFIFPIFILLLAIFSSCYNNTDTNSTGSPTLIVEAATQITPPSSSNTSSAVDITSPILYSEFNMAIEGIVTEEPINELEHIAGPSYQVIGVDFLQEINSSPVLRVKTRCECAENGPCCNYTRTFVITIMVLRKIYLNSSIQTPDAEGKVGTLEVWCYDHASLTKVVSVPWTDVKNFFGGTATGFELWADVTPSP